MINDGQEADYGIISQWLRLPAIDKNPCINYIILQLILTSEVKIVQLHHY